jgi:hypothetical protein
LVFDIVAGTEGCFKGEALADFGDDNGLTFLLLGMGLFLKFAKMPGDPG